MSARSTLLKMSLPKNETTVNLKSASFVIIMRLHEGLTNIYSQKEPRFHFGKSFALTWTPHLSGTVMAILAPVCRGVLVAGSCQPQPDCTVFHTVCMMGLLLCSKSLHCLGLARGQPQHIQGWTTCPGPGAQSSFQERNHPSAWSQCI